MMQKTRSVCCYCGVGCGLEIHHDGQKVHQVTGDPLHPANFGQLCSKGASLHQTGDPSVRLRYPEIREDKSTARQITSWDQAIEQTADRLAAVIAAHGPEAVAFYVSGQLLTEDYYVFNKLARGVIGTPHIDSNSRLCMSSAVAGYKRSLGADAPPCNYEDIELADCVLLAGSNMAVAHPVLFRRLEAARAQDPEKKLIVLDPRRSESASAADLHLALLPGTDVAFFHGLLNILLWEGWADPIFIQAYTDGFAALKAHVRDYTPERVAGICGIERKDLETCARWMANAKGFLSLWCMGLNQSHCGTDKVQALINLHLATGQIGRQGAGPFSLTGQPNAMGGRETGTMASLLPGHRDPNNAAHRAQVAQAWGIDALPDTPGLTAIELFEAVRSGRIKALWIACTNPAQSLPDQHKIREALALCPLVILQEAFSSSETVPYADILLPAASWAEKEGTVTNSERRISRVRQAVSAPGEARADWAIAAAIGQALAARRSPPLARLLDFQDTAQIFAEHVALTAERDLDMSGLTYAILEADGPQQWPFPKGAQTGTARLYQDGIFATDSGRAHFATPDYQPVAEQRDARWPFSLITGRLRDQWHGMTRTGTHAALFGHTDQARLSLSPQDMTRYALKSDELVQVKSRRGQLILPVQADDQLRAGQAFIPMHWGGRYLKTLGCNGLTLPKTDPYSLQPELKHSSVSISRVDLPWTLDALVEGDVQAKLDALRQLADACEFVSLGLIGRERPAVMLRAAAKTPLPAATLHAIDQILGLNEGTVMAYDDPKKTLGKKIRIDQGRLIAVRLAGERAAFPWLKAQFLQAQIDPQLRPWLLAPLATPPLAGIQTSSRMICSCEGVSENAIREGIRDGLDLPALQQQLRCGTGCGACLPEIRQMLAGHF